MTPYRVGESSAARERRSALFSSKVSHKKSEVSNTSPSQQPEKLRGRPLPFFFNAHTQHTILQCLFHHLPEVFNKNKSGISQILDNSL